MYTKIVQKYQYNFLTNTQLITTVFPTNFEQRRNNGGTNPLRVYVIPLHISEKSVAIIIAILILILPFNSYWNFHCVRVMCKLYYWDQLMTET